MSNIIINLRRVKFNAPRVTFAETADGIRGLIFYTYFPKTYKQLRNALSIPEPQDVEIYLISVKFLNTTESVLATVDMVLMKMSSATPTTSLRVSPTVSPVTAA